MTKKPKGYPADKVIRPSAFISGHQLAHLWHLFHHHFHHHIHPTNMSSSLVLYLVLFGLTVALIESYNTGFGRRRYHQPRVYFTHGKESHHVRPPYISYGKTALQGPTYQRQGPEKASVDDWNYYKPGVQEARQRGRSEIGEFSRGGIERALSFNFGPVANSLAKQPYN